MEDSATDQAAARDMMRRIAAFRMSQAISVAATLGIADLLGDGPRASSDLAAASGTDAAALYRLLRALAAEGIFEELPEHRFANNDASRTLRRDAPNSVHAWAEFIGRPYSWQGWGNLLHSVRTGESGVRHVTGMDSWRYREQHPDEGAYFDRAMTQATRALSPAILDAYDFGRFMRIADIAGGHGAQLAAILNRHPLVRGILFDQTHVVAGAPALLREAGVDGRCEVVGGSFFESVPEADAYILKHILHDWRDGDCVRILETIKRAAPPAATLLVIERVVAGPNDGADTKSSDLNMLVGPGGVERTADEFAALLAAGGWHLTGMHPAATHYIIEGVPS